jgi:hypothetical protein
MLTFLIRQTLSGLASRCAPRRSHLPMLDREALPNGAPARVRCCGAHRPATRPSGFATGAYRATQTVTRAGQVVLEDKLHIAF